MNAALRRPTQGELRRVRHARTPRELSAVMDEVEQRLGRELRLSDLEEVVTRHVGALLRKTATFVRQLPGLAGHAYLYELSPGMETSHGDVTTYAVAVVFPGESYFPPRKTSSALLSPATACGAMYGAFVGIERAWHAETAEMAFACFDYDVVHPRELTLVPEQAVA